MSINLDYLANFIVAAEYRNFTAAAERLFINQSTLSRQIQSLEESLHTPLFIRNGKNLSLTRAGHVLYDTGQVLLNQSRELEKLVSNAAVYDYGRITIYSIPAFLDATAEARRMLRDNGIEADIVIQHLQAEDPRALLASNAVDFLIMFDNFMDPFSDEEYVRIPFAREGFCIACAPDEPLSARKTVSFRECQKHNILFGLGFPGLSPLPSHEHGDVSTPDRTLASYHDAVLLGEGILLLPTVVARSFAADLRYIPLSDEDMHYNIELVYKRNRPLTPVGRAYAEAIRRIGGRVFGANG